jgi:hypothetical protein
MAIRFLSLSWILIMLRCGEAKRKGRPVESQNLMKGRFINGALEGRVPSVMDQILLAQIIAWSLLIGGWLLPLAHVLLSSRGGPWKAREGARCPLSPRVGWVVIVLFLGPLGWLMFWRGTSRAA